MDTFLAALFLIVCVLLIIVVLLQKGRGGGLSAAFGGAGGHSAFGTRTGDVFTWVTIVLVAVFILLAVWSTRHFRPTTNLQLDTPRFTPPAQPIQKPQPVRISVGNNPQARIYYTTDGSDPRSKAVEYDESPVVRVEPGMTLKAFATQPGWKDSPVAPAYYPRGSATQPAEPAEGQDEDVEAPPATRPAAPAPATRPAAAAPAR